MLSSNQKEKVIEFLNILKIRNQKINDDKVEKFIHDAFELVENNEYGIALENTLENIYEFEIRISANLFIRLV